LLEIFSRKGGCNFPQRRKEEKGAEVEAVSLRLFDYKEFIT
jgi:hypothetical protein